MIHVVVSVIHVAVYVIRVAVSVIHVAVYDTATGFIKEIHVLQVDMSTWRFIS